MFWATPQHSFLDDSVLIQSGAILDLPNAKFQTPLHLACLGDHGDCVDILLSAGAAVNVRDAEVWSLIVM
jgi:ankyrin repeat protein